MGVLTVERVPLADLIPHPRNPRRGNVEAIAESLQAHGQVTPLVIQRSTGHILGGNQTWKAAATLGWQHLDVVYADVDDQQATKILLVLNRSFEVGDGYDNQMLAGLLNELGNAGSLTGTGFTPDDLDDLLAELGSMIESGAAALDQPGPPGVLPGAPAFSSGSLILDAPPATEAAFAETEEEQEARAERAATQTPRFAQGTVEVILVYSEEDRAELARMMNDAKRLLADTSETDVRSPELVLRAMRTLMVILDARKHGHQVSENELAACAGYHPA